MPFQAVNRCPMASVWWGSDFRLYSLRLCTFAPSDIYLALEADRRSVDVVPARPTVLRGLKVTSATVL